MTNGGCGYRIIGAAVITVPHGTIITMITTGEIGTIDVIKLGRELGKPLGIYREACLASSSNST